MPRYTFLYRDGANYKFPFTKDVEKNLSAGEEITIEELGFTIPQFFTEIVQYPYDPEIDHNIVETIGKIN